jgi:hypothetical protein
MTWAFYIQRRVRRWRKGGVAPDSNFLGAEAHIFFIHKSLNSNFILKT